MTNYVVVLNEARGHRNDNSQGFSLIAKRLDLIRAHLLLELKLFLVFETFVGLASDHIDDNLLRCVGHD